jgi:hypothetical protein
MRPRKANVNGKNIVVLNQSVVAVGHEKVRELTIAGQQDFAIGMKVVVTFEDQRIVGKVSAVIPGTDSTAIRIACPGQK